VVARPDAAAPRLLVDLYADGEPAGRSAADYRDAAESLTPEDAIDPATVRQDGRRRRAAQRHAGEDLSSAALRRWRPVGDSRPSRCAQEPRPHPARRYADLL